MPLKRAQVEDVFSISDKDAQSLLANILYLNLDTNSNTKLVISSVNKLLSVSKTRLQGLEFLNLIISTCSPAVVAENALGWVSHCLIKYPGDSLKELKLTTIDKIIGIVYKEQEFTKKFISDYVSIVLDNCLSVHINSSETEAALGTLTTCMMYYPSWFAPHKLKIEAFLIGFLDNGSEKHVDKAAQAFHILQQVGGGGTGGINHKNNFSVNFEKLCSTVQILFDTLLENEIEIDHSDRSNQDMFHFNDPPNYSQNMLHVTTKRIRNCLKFIGTMLLKSFPVTKEIIPKHVIDVIDRGTAIHKCLSVDIERSLEEFQFSLLLNKVQIQLLQLLRVFIIWLQANSLPFSYTISKILIDCLNKSQNCQCFSMDSIYQETVYKVLSCWLRISKNAVHRHFQTQLIMCIMKDLTPVKSQVTLSLRSDTPKNKSAKAKRKAIQERIISSEQGSNAIESLSNAEMINKESNCLFALNTLKNLLSATTLRIKDSDTQHLYATVINIIVAIQISKINHPYTNINCQAKLYEVLVALYEQETVKTALPLPLTLDVLNRGLNNKNRHIALTCEQGLSILEKLCQPVCPTLFLPMFNMVKDVPKKSQAFIDDKFVDELCEENNVTASNNLDIVKEINVETDLEIDKRVAVQEDDGSSEDTLLYDRSETVQADNGSSEDSLLHNKSIHIIDYHVFPSFSENLEDEQIEVDDLKGNGIAISVESSNVREDFSSEANLVKLEEPSTVKYESNVEAIHDKTDVEGEPPLKKHKNDENIGGLEHNSIKEEPNDTDHSFKEDYDAFVDEIKEY